MKPYPKRCNRCGIDEPGEDHWKWNKDKRYSFGGKWRCKEYVREQGRKYAAKRRSNPELKAADEAARKDYYAENPEYLRYKAYKYADKRKGLPGEPIPWEEASPIMLSPCTYCGVERAGGLDRLDNNLGHCSGNVVAACANCNLILLDMPVALKQVFIPALTSARQKGLLEIWQHPRLRSSSDPQENLSMTELIPA